MVPPPAPEREADRDRRLYRGHCGGEAGSVRNERQEQLGRLMPLDVMALRRAGATDVMLPDKVWV